MSKEKISGKLPKLKIRSLYHRPTEQHRDAKAYRRKGRMARRRHQEDHQALQGGSLLRLAA